MSAVVAVALSGGIDSAVAAALLQRRGFRLLAVYLRLSERPDAAPQAAKVAAALAVPFTVVDFREAFQEAVVHYFSRSYAMGRTPNPCVQCNAAIKFGALWDQVRALGATHLATGHYARLQPAADGEPGLWRAADRRKDQSYFLQRLPRELLASLMFPLGGLTKGAVRRIFRALELPGVETPPESQEVCFIPQGRYPEFLKTQAGLKSRPGDIVDRQGRFLGRHPGLISFTVGQRRGLGVCAQEPLYVVALQPETNRLVVGPKSELLAVGLRAVQANWLIPPPKGEIAATAVIRYRHPGVAACLTPAPDGSVSVRFATPQSAVAPGQAVAFYDGDRLLGGAWIEDKLQD